MRAIVLVGGEGTRLRPLTYTTPKPLLPIANQAFLERQLTWLDRHGIDEVVLSLGYLPDAFAAWFPDDRFGNLTLRYAVEDEPLGTAGGIRYAADVAGIDERFVVCNGDVLTTIDLTDMVAFHDAHGAEATIHLCRVDDPSAFGVVPTRSDGEVMAFVEKPPPGRVPSHWINAGTYVLEPSVLNRIPPRLTVSVERETFPRMLDRRGRLFALQSDAYWIDIGTPEKYLQVHRDILRGHFPVDLLAERKTEGWIHPGAHVDRGAHLEGPFFVGPGCRLEAGARVGPDSTLVADVVLSAGASVRDAVLWKGCHLGEGASVEGALLASHCRVGRSAVVGPGCVLGEKTELPEFSRCTPWGPG